MNLNQSDPTPAGTAENPDTQAAVRDIGFWRETWIEVQLVWRLLRDPAVPFYLKLLPLATLLYLIFPLDLLPDAFLGLGQVDDLGLLLLGWRLFINLSPADRVEEHRLDLAGRLVVGDQALHDSIIVDQKQ